MPPPGCPGPVAGRRAPSLGGTPGFSLPRPFPGWLTECTGLPGVLEPKVMVMPGPRLALDRRAVPAARSPGQRPLCEVWARLCHPGPSGGLPTVRHPQKSTPHSCVGTRPPRGSSDPAAGSPSGSPGVSCIRPALGETHRKPARSRRLSLLPSTMRGDTCRCPHLPPGPRDAPNPEGCKLSAAWAFGLSAWVSTGHPLRVTATGHPWPPSEDWRGGGGRYGVAPAPSLRGRRGALPDDGLQWWLHGL